MDYSVNTRPLLQHSESESDFEDDISEVNRCVDHQDDHVVVTKDLRPLFKLREPSDRYNLAYLIFYLLGMTTLLPWNFFITADDYWMYKFRDASANISDKENRTELQAGFTAYLSVASTIPNTMFLILNTLFSHKISLQVRMIGSLSCIFLLFVLTTVFVEVDTDTWQEVFFSITLVMVVFLNIASAILQGGLFGIVGKFSSRYITAVVSGQALGGIFAALAEIASLCFGASSATSAFVYFMVANVMLLLSLAAYIFLSHSVFFQFHMLDKLEVSTMQYEPAVIQANDNPPSREISYKAILSKIWVYGFSVWMTFVVTLAIYPAVTVLVNSTGKGSRKPWNDMYFVPVVGYLIFSTCDYVGRILAGLLQRPRNKSWVVALLSILRVVFIPLLLLCNAQPRHHLPVLMNSDLHYIVIIVLFALSNGYLANITLICVPKVVDSAEQETASSMMAAFLGIGLACGSALSLAMVNIL
ncbi:equilibrative nucleoside transporter 1 [Zootermopsis nevadensis]|uniref:Equilibrative nucleoside transporter 3 n=1 Tax=Zootermopsis nevadensis TaxID=136037 RepID=A0A067RKJ1_ZOONE|nr:equilibrative nucleoside transporter 1 [Zootermopsis nevadensis]KDR21110.1 Equilibrative nucleoside transporter 3 [Zootermopsis nevadensis]